MKWATIAALTLLIGCSTASPDAGHEAVLIKKPWFIGHGGVDSEPIPTGLTFIALTTTAVNVSKQPIQFSIHFDDLMSSDGVPLDFDAVIRLQIIDSVAIIKNFGPEWYKTNVEAELRNRVRQAVRKHGMNETAINTVAIEAIDQEVSDAMVKYIKSAKLPIRLIQVTVGKANPPDSIKNQRVETAAQQQRELTEVQRAKAELARKIAEENRAKSDNAYREAMQLSPNQFLQLETIKMQQQACSKGPCTFVVGSNPTTVLPVGDSRRVAAENSR